MLNIPRNGFELDKHAFPGSDAKQKNINTRNLMYT